MAATWDDIFLLGTAFDLNASVWSARVQIRPKDLGIEDTVSVNKALSFGCHRLAPPEAFETINEIVTRARNTVEHYSLAFGFLRGARYVPEKNLETLLGKLDKLKVEFDAAVGEFLTNYETIASTMLPILTQALNDAAKTPEAAQEAMLRISSEYPSKGDVMKKFALSWSVFAIRGPKVAGAGNLANQEVQDVKGVLDGMVTKLREEVTTKLGSVLALVNKGGTLKQKSIDSALAVLDHVEAVNILGDKTLASQIGKLRVALSTIEKGKRISDDVVSGLAEIKEALEGDLEEALREAEEQFTGFGRRKLEVA